MWIFIEGGTLSETAVAVSSEKKKNQKRAAGIHDENILDVVYEIVVDFARGGGRSPLIEPWRRGVC